MSWITFSTVRKFKKKSTLGKEGKWEYEVGEDLRPTNAESEHIMESVSNVRVLKYLKNFIKITCARQNHYMQRNLNKKYIILVLQG